MIIKYLGADIPSPYLLQVMNNAIRKNAIEQIILENLREITNFVSEYEDVKKYTDIKMLTPEILREFIDKIIVHAADKSSGRRLQEIEIVYNHIGIIDNSKITVARGKRYACVS